MSEKTPLVSVLTLAYNHAPYIREWRVFGEKL